MFGGSVGFICYLVDYMIESEVKHCTVDDIGLSIEGEGADAVIAPINDYLKAFAASDGKCPKCGAKLGGFLGSFTWGLAHGEGFCTGGFQGECGYPCRGLHCIKDGDGKEIFDRSIPIVLAYHPESLEPNSPSR